MSQQQFSTPKGAILREGVTDPGSSGGSRRRKDRSNNNFKVVLRVRPPLPRELNSDRPFQNIVDVDQTEQVITVSENLAAAMEDGAAPGSAGGAYRTHVFTFDHVYDQLSSQRKVYETTARPVVDSALLGYNATIFAYGQTGTGKTYTMEGFNIEGDVEERGIIPRAIEQIFSHIQTHASPTMRFLVRASYLQIYNEQISDLLKPERNNLAIREDRKRGVYVESLSEWVVRSPAEIYGLMERGGAMRATGSTKMNEISSRSHAVFIIIVEQSETVYVDEDGTECSMEEFSRMMHAAGVSRGEAIARLENHVRQSFKVGKLNLVDLAGSERVRLSGATGQRLEESKKINQSLSALGNVISALTDARGRRHIPYRDSKLTRILEDSLGGNCRTTMMAMISPALESMVESVSTLKFANRAKNIRNEAVVNEDLDQKSLLRKYERELKRLRAELDAKSRSVVDQRRLLELEEQRRRAEADKMAAIRALEARSLEFMREKQAKRHLEDRIATLMGQMIRGDSSAVKDLIDRGADLGAIVQHHREHLQSQYETKLADLERERENVEEEKAQVDRYKHLLLKQRDIMIALTQRLNERDEQIMALQEELDAYDRHQRELEEKLDEKTAQLIHLQRVALEHQASTPDGSGRLDQALGSWASEQAPVTPRVPQPAELQLGQLRAENELLKQRIAQLTEDARPNRKTAEDFRSQRNHDVQRRGAAAGGNRTAAMGDALHGRGRRRQTSEEVYPDGAAPIAIQRQFEEEQRRADALSKSESDLKHQVAALEADLRAARASAEMVSADGAAAAAATAQANARCDALVRERRAVQTIMEQKIRVLLGSVSQSAGALVAGTGSDGGLADALQRDVESLQRLVSASIAALRRAERQDEQRLADANPTGGPPQVATPAAASGGSGARSEPRRQAWSGMSVEEMIQARKQELLEGLR